MNVTPQTTVESTEKQQVAATIDGAPLAESPVPEVALASPSEDSGSKVASGPAPRTSFPKKLMMVLNNSQYSAVAGWSADGKNFWMIPRAFAATALSECFHGCKLDSFKRKLKRWGFQRVSNKGCPREATSYHNQLFLRDHPDLISRMGNILPGRKQSAGLLSLPVQSPAGGVGASATAPHAQLALRDNVPRLSHSLDRSSFLTGQSSIGDQSLGYIAGGAPPLSHSHFPASSSVFQQSDLERQHLPGVESKSRRSQLLNLPRVGLARNEHHQLQQNSILSEIRQQLEAERLRQHELNLLSTLSATTGRGIDSIFSPTSASDWSTNRPNREAALLLGSSASVNSIGTIPAATAASPLTLSAQSSAVESIPRQHWGSSAVGTSRISSETLRGMSTADLLLLHQRLQQEEELHNQR